MNHIGKGPCHGNCKKGYTEQHEVRYKYDEYVGDPYPATPKVRMCRIVIAGGSANIHNENLKNE